MDRHQLGRRLRAMRAARGSTVAAVATEAGLSVPYVANLENGRGNPTLDALNRLAQALGTYASVEFTRAEPESAGPANTEPGAAQRGTAEPARAERGTAEPAGAERGIAEPARAQPGTAEPHGVNPAHSGKQSRDAERPQTSVQTRQAARTAPGENSLPASVVRLGRTARFRRDVRLIAESRGVHPTVLAGSVLDLLAGVAALTGRELGEGDWCRLLDALVLVTLHPLDPHQPEGNRHA